MLGECNLHPRVWSPSVDNRITVSCNAAIKTHPKEIWLPLPLSQGTSTLLPCLLECAGIQIQEKSKHSIRGRVIKTLDNLFNSEKIHNRFACRDCPGRAPKFIKVWKKRKKMYLQI